MSLPGGVCVFSERQDVALELLSAARALAGSEGVFSIVPEAEGRSSALRQVAYGADHAFLVATGGEDRGADLLVSALREAHSRSCFEILLVGATILGTEVAARLAQRLGVGCASECSRIDRQDGALIVERTCLGRFVTRQVVETRPAIVTVQPRRFHAPNPEEGRRGEVEELRIEQPEARTRILETRPREKSTVRIDKADVVVAIGRGLRSRDDLPMIASLARVLDGVVGASRPVTDDLQWLAPDVKVGLSGATVKPKLYIACGISGQIEHNVGMRESGVVVAINSDPAAPIMEQADYRVTGDLHDVIPALTEAVARRKAPRRS